MSNYKKVDEVPDKWDEEFVLKDFSKHNGIWYFDCEGCGFGAVEEDFDNQLDDPKPGDKMRTWGSIGQPIRGIAVNDDVLYYRSPEEQKVHLDKVTEEHQSKLKAEFEKDREQLDKRIANLPTEFQQRFEGYHRAGGDDWRINFEAYELFCCEQAVALVECFQEAGENVEDTVTSIAKWADTKDFKKQKEKFPKLSEDHSNNTFGHMVRMAMLFLAKPELVERAHAAVAPLIGSEAAKDWAHRPENAEEVARLKAAGEIVDD